MALMAGPLGVRNVAPACGFINLAAIGIALDIVPLSGGPLSKAGTAAYTSTLFVTRKSV